MPRVTMNMDDEVWDALCRKMNIPEDHSHQQKTELLKGALYRNAGYPVPATYSDRKRESNRRRAREIAAERKRNTPTPPPVEELPVELPPLEDIALPPVGEDNPLPQVDTLEDNPLPEVEPPLPPVEESLPPVIPPAVQSTIPPDVPPVRPREDEQPSRYAPRPRGDGFRLI